MPRSEFADFLARSLRILQREVPEAFARMAARLGDRGVRLSVDGRPCTLRFGAADFAIEDGEAPAQVEIVTRRGTILDLVDARLTLEDAIRSDRVFLRGPVDGVGRFHAALLSFLNGAMRASSMPEVLTDYRALGVDRS